MNSKERPSESRARYLAEESSPERDSIGLKSGGEGP